MAKKKSPEAEPVPAIAEEIETKPVGLRIDIESHRLLRQVAAAEGLSMSAFARQHFEQFLRQEAVRLGIRIR